MDSVQQFVDRVFASTEGPWKKVADMVEEVCCLSWVGHGSKKYLKDMFANFLTMAEVEGKCVKQRIDRIRQLVDKYVLSVGMMKEIIVMLKEGLKRS